jgi:hypothetical protein
MIAVAQRPEGARVQMKIFAFDPDEYRDHYREHEWVHVKGGIAPEFLEFIREQAHEQLEAHRLDALGIKGKKEQSLFEFPPEADYPGELFDTVSRLCGLDRETITLSERHIQAYEANAAPEPHAHKDRFASQVSLGFSIDIPAESKLVLFPWEQRQINAFNSSHDLRASLRPDELPEVVAKTCRELVLDDEPGDIVAFAGNNTWHLRRNAANAINLYCKFNDYGCDPLGEDPRTASMREETLAKLAASNGSLGDHVARLSRQFDSVEEHYARDWQPVLRARVWGSDPFGVSEAQVKLLRAVDGSKPLAQLAAEVGASEAEARHLAEVGALDLV